MNVDEAMETAAAYLAFEQEGEPLWFSEEVAITLAKEVERLRAELAEAKAASVCPVELVALGDADWECSVGVKCKSSEDADRLYNWLRDRTKDKSPPEA